MKMLRLPETFPRDDYNLELLANVHPPDWKDPQPGQRYNLVVLGAGTAGLVTAAAAASLGARVALVERHLMGGDCLNVGCVPSKCIIRSSRAYADVREAHSFGVTVPKGTEVDFSAVMERMRRVRAHISRHDSAGRFQGLGVDVFLGDGRFAGPDRVEVNGNILRFKKAVIATGARATAPPIEGLPDAGYLTNETVFDLTERPDRLLVIGSGPIGCELAQAFCRLGSHVTVVELLPKFLPPEDRDAAAVLQHVMERDGVRILLNAKSKRVTKSGSERIVLVEQDGREEQIVVDAILVGVGRAPNVEGLDLESAGVQYDGKKGVSVNDRLQTTNRRIYAAGDVCLPHKFTHTADATARIVIQNTLFLGRKKWGALTIPWCTYTDPEIAHVGLYEHQAREKGIAVQTFEIALSEIDRALIDGEEQGFVKIHIREGTDKILGATIVARHAGEMISEISVALAAGLGLAKLSNVIHPYPTQAEGIRKAADAYNRTRLTPFVKKVLHLWLSMIR